MKTCACHSCGTNFERTPSAFNRAEKAGGKHFCSRACFGDSRKVVDKRSTEQKKLAKAEYDRQRRAAIPEILKTKKKEYYQKNREEILKKMTAGRKDRMPKHVEYCRRPEYKIKKRAHDIKVRCMEYGDFDEAWRLLLDLEKEIRSRLTKYERLVAKGYFSRNARERRRELCRIKKNSVQAI
ncbi:MAG: hypothetical protein ACRCVX_10700 [Shewanella sp.]